MDQLTQTLKDGAMQVTEVPWPTLNPGSVLVRNHYSLISAGTEGSTVETARKNLIGKAKERPQQVKQVISVLKAQGPVQTYRAVMKKLDALSPLGYSCVGEIIEVGAAITDLRVGDFVGCGGLSANHAEIVAVPRNLCARIPVQTDSGAQQQLKAAAYNTLGAIALQGIRQADLRLGESCAVIGLGLLGQLSCALLRAGGIKVVGLDIDANAVAIAARHCTDLALTQHDSQGAAAIHEFTDGLGVDAVIITAAASSLQPINFAGEIARKRGRIVIVGNVPTGFDREPHYYRKELEVRMSCSYGPGRYDANYEEKGMDYPAPYVRWTENRNMEAFQSLIASKSIDLDYLTTHEFTLAEAPKAYDMILQRDQHFLGILICYDTAKTHRKAAYPLASPKPTASVGLAFIGAGNYAQGNILPHLPKHQNLHRKTVMSASGTTSKRVAERYGFEACTSTKADIFENQSINTVFVCTRHDSHAEYILDALNSRKHIFVEKPLCLREDELVDIESAYNSSNQVLSSLLMVGYNRRFAPLATELKKSLGDTQKSVIYRINAGRIPDDHWIHDRDIGGGRIIGEVCHFVDFMTFICDSPPSSIYASACPQAGGHLDTIIVNISFENGSIGTIGYFANGSSELFKEHIEVHCGGISGIIQDFKALTVYGNDRPLKKKLINQDKGQCSMINSFIHAVQNGEPCPIEPAAIFSVANAVFAIERSIRTGLPQKL